MTTFETTADLREEVEHRSASWWVLVITGIAWILVSVLVLDANFDSALTIGYLVGGFMLALGVTELVLLGAVEGWKWLHAIVGIVLIIGGIAAFTEPFRTFAVLASLFGFLLVLKGTFDFVVALAARHEADLWWVLLATGVLEVLLGFWAASYPGRSASLLIIWVGIGALLRGITQLVMAFQVRKIHGAVA
jgi:uncharacterized membrane protein HdeD (DUF308 family)